MSKGWNDLDSVKKNESANNLIITDSLNLAFRWKHSNKKAFGYEFKNTVASFANSYAAKDVILLSDGGSTYRKNLFPEYKGNRKKLRENQTKEEAETFEEFMQDFKSALELCDPSYPVIRFDGVEADDIAAYLVKVLKDKYDHIWLISTDKDWDLLIDTNVSKFSYRTRKETTLENWNEHYDYKPEDHISVKTLAGDSGDNIPGVAGIGEKRAATLLKQYGTAFDIYDNLPLPGKQKFIQNLNAFGDQLLLNYELMDLVEYSSEAIGINNIEEIKITLYERLGIKI